MQTELRQTFNNFLATQLNDAQRAAVEQHTGALLVIAGAGSGKTRVITSRIAHLVLNHNVPAHSIVALTFTNKAAGEMRERLIKTFQAQHQPPFIGTFHAYCLLLLRAHSHLLPFPRFTIIDADDQLDLIKKICKKYVVSKYMTPAHITHAISNYKNGVAEQKCVTDPWPSSLVRDIYVEYEHEKTQSHCLDFDDLLVWVLKLLQTNATFKEQLQNKVRHILVDEYQDTSHVQHQLLLHLARDDKKKFTLDSMCAVGDEDQSIYSWRGATVTNMLTFANDFAPVTRVRIEQNYRSVQPILQAANSVIEHNVLRNPKELWSTREAKHRILHVACNTGDQEAQTIAALIASRRHHKAHQSLAVLYRTHYQSRTLEEALIHRAIPYRIIGGIRFYERKEIKDLLAYVRLVANPYDKISFMRVINTPTRGLGEKTEDQLLHAWATQPLFDFTQIIKDMCANADSPLPASKRTALTDFSALFEGLSVEQSPRAVLDQILERTNYIGYLAENYEPTESQAKIDNVQELAQAVLLSEQKGQDLETFLHEVSLLQEKIDADNATDFVPLMTLHAAKGLEFNTVIIAGLEEGLLPNNRSLNSNEELEEERRLMYVGMTRAEEYLIVTSAQSRFTFGHIVDQARSRFLDEIPKNLVQTITLDNFTVASAPTLIEQWFAHGTTTPVSPRFTPPPYPHASASPHMRPTPASAAKTARTPWAKNQTVFHQKFGVGIITDVEKAPEQDFYITALFKCGKKKILASFLSKH
ncbi:MAG: UvrD-helicase domain-containing protein [Candidatus Babeliales bacterium]|jgi:DNA helicase-2/ATP-dependent DNA helicase PcrA